MNDILIKALYNISDSDMEDIPKWLQDPINVVLSAYVPEDGSFESKNKAENEINEIVSVSKYYGFRQGLRVGLKLAGELDMKIGKFSK